MAFPMALRRMTHEIDYELEIREHVGMLKNPLRAFLKLNNLGQQYLALECDLYDSSLAQPFQRALAEFQKQLQIEFKAPTKVSLYKQF